MFLLQVKPVDCALTPSTTDSTHAKDANCQRYACAGAALSHAASLRRPRGTDMYVAVWHKTVVPNGSSVQLPGRLPPDEQHSRAPCMTLSLPSIGTPGLASPTVFISVYKLRWTCTSYHDWASCWVEYSSSAHPPLSDLPAVRHIRRPSAL
jgi:hypothetical protein